MVCLVVFGFMAGVTSYIVKKRQIKLGLFLLCFPVIGFLAASSTVIARPPALTTHTLTYCRGVVREVGVTASGNSKLFIRTADIAENGRNIDLYVIWTGENRFAAGDWVQFSGEVLPLSPQTVPGGYNEALYLGTKEIAYKAFPEDMLRIGRKKGLFTALQKMKEKTFRVIDTVLPQEEAGIVKAMVTGERDDISDETRELYTKAGINHILCVSGLHLSLFAMLITFVVEKLLRQNQRRAAVATIFCCISFVVFTGFSPSSVRALIMIVIMLMGKVLYRRGDMLNSLGIAGLVILLIQPLYLWNAGFQLSFITVFGIWTALQAATKEKGWCARCQQAFYLSLYASLFSYPIVAYHFYSISLIGVLVNILLLPFCGILLASAFLTAVCGLLFPPLAAIFSGGVYGILLLYKEICSFAVSLPFSYMLIGAPSLLTIFLYYGILLLCTLCRKEVRLQTGVMLLLLYVSIQGNRLFLHQNSIAFLDVGQGDATVISTFDGRVYIIDGGGKFGVEMGRNTGAQTIQPYLEYLGEGEIDGIFLTHFDDDHMLGVMELCDSVSTKALYIADYPFESNEKWEELKEILEKREILLYTVSEGDFVQIGQDEAMCCLSPPAGIKYTDADDNHGSLVLKYCYGGTEVLLMGDAAISDENVMLMKGLDVAADILKLGHHGSQYSSGEAFLQETAPEVAIISCGENNRYGHPHEETLERLERLDIPVYRTDTAGTIVAELSRKGDYSIRAVSERESVYEGIKKTMEKRRI